MKKIIFATMNPNKRFEVNQMVAPRGIEVIGLDQLGHQGDIPEDQDTIQGNAIQKAQFIYSKYGEPCFSEDTGLEVPSLNGEPGVHTAYYGGPERSASKNITKLLRRLNGSNDRKAQFRTVIAYHDGKDIHLFEGVVTGNIGEVEMGQEGFGYDPVFIPDGFDRSFAQLPTWIKNRFSHRARAWRKLIAYL